MSWMRRRIGRRTLHWAAAPLSVCVSSGVVAGCDETFYFDVPVVQERADAASMGLPSRCSADSDCGLASLHCDVATGRCFECVVDEDCSDDAGQRCEPLLHRCVQCLVARDCAAGFTCDPTTHRCLQSCVAENECAPEAHGCDERRGVCIACDEDDECEASYCAFDGTGCVECRVDSHCSTGRACDILSGKCVQCRDTGDCAAGSACDPATDSCVAVAQ